MNAGQRIYDAVKALVGNRAYPLRAPDNVARPYIVFVGAGVTSSYTLAQVGNNDRRRVQVDIYSDASQPFDGHETLAKAVRSALEADGARLASDGQAFEPDTNLYRTRLDVYLWHRPAT